MDYTSSKSRGGGGRRSNQRREERRVLSDQESDPRREEEEREEGEEKINERKAKELKMEVFFIKKSKKVARQTQWSFVRGSFSEQKKEKVSERENGALLIIIFLLLFCSWGSLWF